MFKNILNDSTFKIVNLLSQHQFPGWLDFFVLKSFKIIKIINEKIKNIF